MNAPAIPVPLSVLDRSRLRAGQPAGQALRDTVDLARRVEALGFRRFWVSEHHGVPGIAGSAPTVLAAAVAAATSRIRVGTGGVMLPNHRTLVVAEQFGVLESLFPGRIDMGLGRSVGFTGPVRRALGAEKDAVADFGDQLAELAGWFTDGVAGVRAQPAPGLRVPAFVLANDAGAELAGRAGAALVIGGLGRPEALAAAVDRYREAFRRTVWGPRPYVVLAGDVAVAGSTEQAARLLVPEAWALVQSRVRGEFPPLLPAGEVEALPMTDRERDRLDVALRGHLHGTEPEVAQALREVVERTGADEVLVTTSTFDRAELLDSHHRLARLAGTA